MGDEQVDAERACLLGDSGGRVDRQQYGSDLGLRIPERQADGVPRLGQRRREPVVEWCHHVSEPHVGPAGLEPTTFPV